MTANFADIVLEDAELALSVAENPQLQIAIAGLSPVAAALMKFLPVLLQGVQGIKTIVDETGVSAPVATAAVIEHLTPGAPNSPALS